MTTNFHDRDFSRKDLMIRGLPDRIHDCHQMNMLYPSIPKVDLIYMFLFLFLLLFLLVLREDIYPSQQALFNRILIFGTFQDQAFGKYYSSPPETVYFKLVIFMIMLTC